MELRDKIHSVINEHIDIDDTYAYHLTRVKEAFSVGTVTLEDFEEWTDADVADLTDSIMDKISPALNENQQVVLTWLKRWHDDDPYFTLSELYESVEPGEYKYEYELDIAYEKLSEKERFQVLAAFAEWGMKDEQ